MKRRKTQIKTILVVLLALLLAFIWLHSMMPAEDSAEESQRVGQFLTPFLELLVGEGNVTDHLVRKLAHFCEYGALGILAGALLLVKLLGFLKKKADQWADDVQMGRGL